MLLMTMSSDDKSMLFYSPTSASALLFANKLSILGCPAFTPLHIGAAFSILAFFTLAYWSYIFRPLQSNAIFSSLAISVPAFLTVRIFRSRIFSCPVRRSITASALSFYSRTLISETNHLWMFAALSDVIL